jgi:hypothetical protein
VSYAACKCLRQAVSVSWKLSRDCFQELLDDVDRDGSGECEYPEFVEIMTISLSRIREQQEKSGEKDGPDISFDLMATAYRRKRLMEGLMSGDKEVQNQILTMASSQLAADDNLAAERAKVTNEKQKAQGNRNQLNFRISHFGAPEKAVIRRMATKLPVPQEPDSADWRDLEKLARFGLAGVKNLRRPIPADVLTKVCIVCMHVICEYMLHMHNLHCFPPALGVKRIGKRHHQPTW